MPRRGDIVHLGRQCGVPYAFRAITVRVVAVIEHQHLADGAWFDVCELDDDDRVIDRRDIYVGRIAGIQPVAVAPRAAPVRRILNDRRAAVPQQRTPARTPARSTR